MSLLKTQAKARTWFMPEKRETTLFNADSILALTLAYAFAMPFMCLPKDNALLELRARTFFSLICRKLFHPHKVNGGDAGFCPQVQTTFKKAQLLIANSKITFA